MKPLAIRAVYSDLKLIRSRGAIQIVLECPIEDQAAVLDVLAGFPAPGESKWFAIAPMPTMEDQHEVEATSAKSEEREVQSADTSVQRSTKNAIVVDRSVPASSRPPRAKRDWRELGSAQQAGIRCEEMAFSAFLQETYPDHWYDLESDPAACVRVICEVESRAHIDRDHRSRVLWHQLNDQYEAWLKVGA